MAANTKNWNTRLTDITDTISAVNISYSKPLATRINKDLDKLGDARKKTLSNSLHLNKQKSQQIRKYVRAIALLELLYVDQPRSVQRIVNSIINEPHYLILSELKKSIKHMDPASPNPPDLAKYRKLLIGCSISGGDHPGPGTIACFVRCNKTGKMMLLGNEHVMKAEFGTRTETAPAIFQPSKGNGATSGDQVATYARGILDQRIDAAVAYLAQGIEWENRTPEGTVIRGVSSRYQKDDRVWKRGTASRVTHGYIEDASANKSVPHARFGGTIHFGGQIEVKVLPPKSEFQIPGDSGSALFNAEDHLIGLMHGGGKEGGGIATPIETVFQLLDVSLP